MNVLINISERRFHLNSVTLRIMDWLIQMGKDLGYEGEKLQDFVKQHQDYERGERIAERGLERDRIAAQEKERADKLAAQEKDREIELARIATQENEGRISSRRKKKIGK